MKFRVTMKTPGVLSEAIHEAGVVLHANRQESEGIYCAQCAEVSVAMKLVKKWFKHSEIVTLEIDTEAQTCTVVETE